MVSKLWFEFRPGSSFLQLLFTSNHGLETTIYSPLAALLAKRKNGFTGLFPYFSIGNGQLSLIFGVPNFCAFSLLVLCLFKLQVEAKKRT